MEEENKERLHVRLEKANIFLLVEFLATIAMSLFSHFYLKETAIAGIVLMVGILITFSTYTLKAHVIDENRKQTEHNKKY